MKQESEENFLKTCTFKPQLNTYKGTKDDGGNRKDVAKKLYTDAIQKANKMKEYKTPDWEYEKAKNELTFSPKITKVDYSIFSNTCPTLEDEVVKKSVERIQRARIV